MLALMAVILFAGYDLSKKKLETMHTQLAAQRDAQDSRADAE